ncbi:MAG: rhomboid family intramembrane serine protease [Burkholderiales bacterium]|nr:rhomboid family intramembrane serine protease [Burkholderiales bacterium]MDE2396577.1 rhomboid family intramembrane serine protease [Burkholderiales bacterium]
MNPGTAPVSTLLLLAIVGLSALGLFAAPGLVERCLFRPYWFWRRGQYASAVTSAFVHADLGHLFFNGFTFWAFGFGLERAIGSARFALLYATGLGASAIGTYYQHRQDPGYATLGASGAILAVLFASIVYFPTSSIYVMPLPVPVPAPLFALGYLAFTWYAARHLRGRVNHDAHLAGALAGIGFVALSDPAALARAWHLVLG